MCKALADMISRERKLGYDSGVEEGRDYSDTTNYVEHRLISSSIPELYKFVGF